jgi:hypothetical protein
MRSNLGLPAPDEEGFLAALGELAASFGWRLRSFKRDDELIALVALDHDPSFEQILWVYDTSGGFVRCLLVSRGSVPAEREAVIFELCARINDGLVFGCAEYSFDDRVLVFRDSVQLGYGKMPDLLASVSARLLDLGSRYSPAIRATLAGTSAIEAMGLARDPPKKVRSEGSSQTH